METERHGLIHFTTILDSERGNLTFIELPQDIGFEVKRVFYVYGNKPEIFRGGHSHKKCKQVLICLKGHVIVYIDGLNEKEGYGAGMHYHLDTPNSGLFIDTETRADIYFPDEDSILMVLASEHYDPEDYINEYQVP